VQSCPVESVAHVAQLAPDSDSESSDIAEKASLFFNPTCNPILTRLLRIIKYLAVPGSLVSYCKYLMLPL
jgi:hypothetical protein